MSLFQAGPYRSKVLGSVVRQSHRWLDQVSIGLRSLRSTLSLAGQILVYPIYATFQTLRVAGAKLRQAIALAAEQTQPPPPPVAEIATPRPAVAYLTPDTPIAQVLLAIQKLPLPVALPIELPALQLPPPGTGVAATRAIAAEGWAGSHSQANLAAIEFVRGIATSLETRSYVLVTNHNQILDILTAEQQAQLRQQIVWEVANYGRYLKSRQATQKFCLQFHLPNPDPLLQAAKQTWNQLKGWFQPDRPAPALLPESPIHQALSVVQRFSLPQELPILLPQLGGLVKAGDPACERVLSLAGKPLPAQAIGLAGASLPNVLLLGRSAAGAPESLPETLAGALRSTREVIRGVATLLETKALVLVTNRNAILDVLTAEQQGQIRQKITWEVAHYGRYLQIQQTTQRALSRLQPATESSPVLPPVRAFQQLMAWVQSGSVAIAANLFHESALMSPPAPAVALPPAGAASPSALPRAFAAIVSQPQFSLAGVGATLGSTSHLPLVAPARPAASPPNQTPKPSRSLGRTRPIAATPPDRSPLATAPRHSPVSTPDYIDISSTPLGYIQPFWEKLLRWLDGLLCFLETQFVAFWHWCWQQIEKR